MKRAALLLVAASLASSLGCVPTARTQQPGGAPDTIRKVSRVMTWEPGPEGTQMPLWPEGVAIQRPESDRPEEVGNGSKLVAGRPWTWASYVSRPTMTIYQPRERKTRAAILVLPGGGYAAVAMDLEGTEICDWVTAQGMTCVVLKYRVPQAWRHGSDGAEEAPRVQLPLQDAQRAIGLLRQHASSWGPGGHAALRHGRPRVRASPHARAHHHGMARAGHAMAARHQDLLRTPKAGPAAMMRIR